MSDYRGTIIRESLENTDVLGKIKILKTKVEAVTEKHRTPWVTQWTLLTVEIPDVQAVTMAETLCKSLDRAHAWYADFKNSTHHYVIFRDRVFYIDRKSKSQYDEARRYGIALGIPEYQVDFHPDIEQWAT